jgi:hypothetical protein
MRIKFILRMKILPRDTIGRVIWRIRKIMMIQLYWKKMVRRVYGIRIKRLSKLKALSAMIRKKIFGVGSNVKFNLLVLMNKSNILSIVKLCISSKIYWG